MTECQNIPERLRWPVAELRLIDLEEQRQKVRTMCLKTLHDKLERKRTYVPMSEPPRIPVTGVNKLMVSPSSS